MSPKRAGLSEPHAARSPRPGLRERGSLCAPGSSLLAVRSPRPLPVQAETVSPASRKPRGPRGRAPPHPGRGSSSVCLGRATACSPGAASGATAHRSSPGCSAHSPRSRVFPALDGSDHVVILGHCWEHSLFLVCFMRILCRVFFSFLALSFFLCQPRPQRGGITLFSVCSCSRFACFRAAGSRWRRRAVRARPWTPVRIPDEGQRASPAHARPRRRAAPRFQLNFLSGSFGLECWRFWSLSRRCVSFRGTSQTRPLDRHAT